MTSIPPPEPRNLLTGTPTKILVAVVAIAGITVSVIYPSFTPLVVGLAVLLGFGAFRSWRDRKERVTTDERGRELARRSGAFAWNVVVLAYVCWLAVQMITERKISTFENTDDYVIFGIILAGMWAQVGSYQWFRRRS